MKSRFFKPNSPWVTIIQFSLFLIINVAFIVADLAVREDVNELRWDRLLLKASPSILYFLLQVLSNDRGRYQELPRPPRRPKS